MKKLLILLIGFSVSLTLSSPSSAGELVGQVTDLVSGSPIAGAKILLLHEKKTIDYRTATNKDGKFSIKNIYKGTYDIVIIYPDNTEKKVESVEIETKRVTALTYAQLAMEPVQSILTDTGKPSFRYGQISGQVLDKKNNEPLTDAVVRLFFSDGTPAKIGARTDDKGNFIVLSVSPGIYYAEISYGPTSHKLRIKDVQIEANRAFIIGTVKLPEKPFEEGDTVYVGGRHH